MALLYRRWRTLLPLYLTIIVLTCIYAPYVAEARYTLPARPAFMLFVAVALSRAFRSARHSLEAYRSRAAGQPGPAHKRKAA